MKTFSSTKIGLPQEKIQTKTLSFPNRTSFISLGSTCAGSDIVYEQKFQRKLEFYQMAIEKQHYRNFTQVHQWRNKTSLPIVKSLYLDVVDNSSDMVKVEIYYQYLPQRLDSIFNIPLPQGLYLLKQSLVGFERLFYKFGSFYPTDKMIGINQNNKCRVWLNENINENRCNYSNINEEEFCTKVLYLVRNHLIQSDLMNTLWSVLLENPTFFQLMKEIDIFSAKNKMKVPNRFQIQQVQRIQNYNKGPQNNLAYSKYSSNSIVDKKSQNNGFRSQYRIGKKDHGNIHHKVVIDHLPIGNYASNKFSENGKLQIGKKDLTKSFREYKAYTPPAPGTPQTPMRHYQSKFRNKTSSIFRSSDIDEQFLGGKQQNNRNRKYSFKQFVPKKSIVAVEKQQTGRRKNLQQNEDNQQQKQKMNSILNKHGWQLKVDNLLGVGNVKDSIIDGADVPMSDSLIKCEKLDAYTNEVVQSMLPNDYDLPDDINL